MKNTVKRISILASAFVMTAASLFTGMSAAAEKTVDLTSGYAAETINLSDAEAVAGNCVMVKLSLNTGNQCMGYNLDIEFDSNLTLKSVDGAATWEVNGNVATIIGFSAVGYTDGKDVAALYFETPEAAEEGASYSISVANVGELATDDGGALKVEADEIKNSVVEVVETAKKVTNYIDVSNSNGKLGLRGDANNDGKVDLYDAIKIAKFMVKTDKLTDVEQLQADVNGDKKVDLYDAVAICKFTLSGDKTNAWASILK